MENKNGFYETPVHNNCEIEQDIDESTDYSPSSPNPMTPPRLSVTWPHVHHPAIVPLEAEKPDAVTDPRLNRKYPSGFNGVVRTNPCFGSQSDTLGTTHAVSSIQNSKDEDEEPPTSRRRLNEDDPTHDQDKQNQDALKNGSNN